MPHDINDRMIPLYEEQVAVTKKAVISDRVRVSTSVEERSVLIEDDLERGGLHVERIAVDRPVHSAPEPRQDGDALIVSIVEERVVIERRLFVVEEVRLTRTSTTEHVAIPETVRVTRATVERADPISPAGSE
ncbi:YsnF/AvaK domain-containing protein [Sphingomonas nostoxanthinifaciens]|uniref:YsnF/AvaK domain-containing protein n=1 Tax=Sphingomonas nostoxanthinifaciens TaxID=2872652 RepID=UPI001CC1E851|nr:YsnF/AvaK domain-containing protein [Sphingomonas nostoxanthinifaciens]UAK25627.1 YsnF/AvaK domain-containing protein [Sphingomonas nostoxanthinifaciens]